MSKHKLKVFPTLVSGAAIYPYTESLMEQGCRVSRFGEEYQLFRVIGPEGKQRIQVPRAMAPVGSETDYAEGLDVYFKSSFKPRNTEQSRVISEAVSLLKDEENFVTQCPTGFGKTACGMDIIAKIGKKTLVVVTKEDLRNQWIEACKKFLGLTPKEIGLIQGDTFRVSGCKVVIAMIQSLAKEDRYPSHAFKEFGFVVWDECHRVAADFFAQSGFRLPAKLRMGLSATPQRKDGKDEVIEAHIGPVMVQSEAAPLTPRIIARKSPWTVPLVRVKDKKTGQAKVGPLPHSPGKCGHVINMLANHVGRNQMMAKFIKKAYDVGRTVIVQSDRKEHLETLFMMANSLGVPAKEMGYYVGGMKEKDLDLAKGKRVIFATYQMTAEGTDIPWLDTLVMASPKSDVRQIVGRIIRAYEGKKNAGEEGEGFDPVVFDPIDYSSSVFAGYWNSRSTWYRSISAPIDLGKAA